MSVDLFYNSQNNRYEPSKIKKYMIVSERQPQNTQSGTFSNNAWRDRVLNTTDYNDIDGASLNTGTYEITLPKGKYYLKANTIHYKVNRNKARIYNNTNSSVIELSLSYYCDVNVARGANINIETIFTLSSQSNIILQSRCETTRSNNGYGIGGNIAEEIFTKIYIEKLE